METSNPNMQCWTS